MSKPPSTLKKHLVVLAESPAGRTRCTAAPTPLHHLLYHTSVQSALNPHTATPSSLCTVLFISPSLSPSLSVSSSLLLTTVGLCQGLVIGFSAAFSLRLPEMSDRWWPLVYIPCICCKALIYLIRGTCVDGGEEERRRRRVCRSEDGAFYYECKTQRMKRRMRRGSEREREREEGGRSLRVMRSRCTITS